MHGRRASNQPCELLPLPNWLWLAFLIMQVPCRDMFLGLYQKKFGTYTSSRLSSPPGVSNLVEAQVTAA